MIGITIILAVSALLLHYLIKGNLLDLGLKPTKRLLVQFIFSFLFIFIVHQGLMIAETLIRDVTWQIASSFERDQLLDAVTYHLKSAAFEELVFRGAIFLILMHKLGAKWAILISSFSFGIYHWFTYDLFGQPVQMAFTFLWTGLAGAVFAWTFLKSGSILIPFAMHFAWNISNALYSRGSSGELFLVEVSGEQLTGLTYIILYLIFQLTPLAAMCIFVSVSPKCTATSKSQASRYH